MSKEVEATQEEWETPRQWVWLAKVEEYSRIDKTYNIGISIILWSLYFVNWIDYILAILVTVILAPLFFSSLTWILIVAWFVKLL